MLPQTTFRKVSTLVPSKLLNFKGDFTVGSVSTDTRTLKRGDVYLALEGPNFNGNDHWKEAEKKGARAFILNREVETNLPLLVAKNPFEILVSMAKLQRQFFLNPVIAITGSAGKSSTKDMTATLLGDKTLSSPASFNNLLGVSKTLCLLEPRHENMVLEMGMNAPNEIKEMVEAFKPNIGCITNIGSAHIGKLGGIEAVYKAKKEMFDFLASSSFTEGIALNRDDEKVVRAFNENSFSRKVKVFSYSMNDLDNTTVGLLSREMNPDTAFLKVIIQVEGDPSTFELPIFGLHHAQNILAAYTLARLGGASDAEIKDRISFIQPALHRGEIYQLRGNRILIDESYNSNPDALKASIESFSCLNPQKKQVLVLGEMRELEGFTISYHEAVAEFLAEKMKGREVTVIAVGVEGMEAFTRKLKRISPQISVHYFSEVKDSLPEIERAFSPGSACLIKGSRGVQLEKAVESIRNMC